MNRPMGWFQEGSMIWSDKNPVNYNLFRAVPPPYLKYHITAIENMLQYGVRYGDLIFALP